MQKKTLIELIHDLEQELLRLGYAPDSMKFFRIRWRKLLKLAQEQGESLYSEQLGIDFLEKYHHIFEKDFNHTLSPSNTQEMHVIRMIGNFQLHHAVLCRYSTKYKEILTEPYFINIRERFKSYCVRKDHSKTTIKGYVRQATLFMDYLVSQNVRDCKEINLTLIHAYIKTLVGCAYKTLESHICALRAFFRFLLEIEAIEIDLAAKMPVIQERKQTSIPSVWTAGELQKLIAAIDRGSPKGKRDYAMILMACCLGMRSADIKYLKMENFCWEEKKLVFTQSKTSTPLSLPLIPEVGWAVIDYLKYGRPKIDSPYIFLRHIAPYGAFAESDHLGKIIEKYMKLAHLPTLKRKRGMHSLRHTMASMLLEKNTPLATIADILGHVDTNSTAIYLKVGIEKLKECALDF